MRIDERGLGFSSASLDGLRYAGDSEIVDVGQGIVGFEIAPDFTVEVDYLRGSASLSMRAFQGDTRLPDPVLEEGDVTVDLYALRGRFRYPPRSSLQGSSGVAWSGGRKSDGAFGGRRGRIETLHHPSITVGASVSF